jgi:hypothetical protein
MRADYAQRLVVSNSLGLVAGGSINTLKLTVPSSFDGGWQLDVAFGAPLPIVGNIGATYSGGSINLLKTAAAGFIGAAAP